MMPVMSNPYVVGGLISAGGSLLSGLTGGLFSSSSAKSASKAQLQATRETNEQNYRIWQEQRQHSIDMWNMENDYNSPINQRARLESAGYNPYLAFGDVGNTAGSVNVPSAPTMIAPDSSAFPNTGEIFAQHLNLGINNALNSLSTIADVANKNQDTANKGLENSFFRDTYDFRRKGYEYDLAGKYWQNEKSYWDYKNAEFDNKLKNETKGLQIDILEQQRNQLKLANFNSYLDSQSKSILLKYLDKNQELELNKSAQTLYNMYRDGLIKEQQLKTEIANTFLTYARAKGQDLENQFNEKTLDNRIKIVGSQRVSAFWEASKIRLDTRIAFRVANNYVAALNAQYYKDYEFNTREGNYYHWLNNQIGDKQIRYSQDLLKGYSPFVGH